MLDLIIDTSTATCSISLFDDQSLLASYHEFIGRGHAEVLIPEIKKIMSGRRAENIYVNVGPGSFTGIRIGISAARALAMAWDIECHGYSTMQLMAAIGLTHAADHGLSPPILENLSAIDIVMSGGHGEFYMQSFGYDRLPMDEIKSLTPANCQLMCTAPLRIGDKAAALDDGATAKIIDISVPDTRLFKQIEPYDHMAVKPLYIRPPDAQIAVNKSISAASGGKIIA